MEIFVNGRQRIPLGQGADARLLIGNSPQVTDPEGLARFPGITTQAPVTGLWLKRKAQCIHD